MKIDNQETEGQRKLSYLLHSFSITPVIWSTYLFIFLRNDEKPMLIEERVKRLNEN